MLGGEPLIVRTIRHALAVADKPEDVVVSTDSEEIASVARAAGANVPFVRPAELATDTASSRDVILHAADWWRKNSPTQSDPSPIVLLQPTSPFRNTADIKKAVEIFNDKKPDMVVSVKPAATNPYYNAYEQDASGALKISKGKGEITRRQDAPPVWEFDGSIYVIDTAALRKYPSLAAMPRILPVVNSTEFNIDIDTELDLRLAELILSMNNNK